MFGFVAAALVLGGQPGRALAGYSDPFATGGMVGGTPTVLVVQGAGGWTIATASVGSAGSGVWQCRYVSLDVRAMVAVTPEAGKAYLFECRDGSGVVVYRELTVYDPLDPAGGVLAAQRAAQIAVAQLRVPDPVVRTSPPETSALLVGLATWLWIHNWEPQSASATLAGLTATVTATPTAVRFDTGDGATVACRDGGVPYDPSRPPDAQSSGCTHVYTRRSTIDDPAGTYTLTATVTYDVTWYATNGQTGRLDPLTRTASIPVKVVESQPVSAEHHQLARSRRSVDEAPPLAQALFDLTEKQRVDRDPVEQDHDHRRQKPWCIAEIA
jgi:hypothetical protein